MRCYMENYVVLLRLTGYDECEAIKNGDESGIGHKAIATVLNTSDAYTKDKNVCFCYMTEVQAEDIEEAKMQIEEYPDIITEENLGECLSYMLKEKENSEPDEYSLMYFVLSEQDYDKFVGMGKIEEAEGFYQNRYAEKLEVPERVVSADLMSTLYSPKNAGSFSVDYLKENGYLDSEDEYEEERDDELFED